MKDDELRAFLESATVGGENEEQPAETAAESIVLPSAPSETTPATQRFSFDELIEQGIGGSSASDAQPIVLPGPPDIATGRGSSLRSTGGLPPTEPIITPPAAPQAAAPQAAAPQAAAPKAAAPRPTAPSWPATPASAAPTEPLPAPVSARPAMPTAAPLPPTRPVAVAPISSGAASLAGAGTGMQFRSEPEEDYERIAVTGGAPKSRHVIPWIIVAAGAVVALIAAFFIITSLTSGNGSNEAGTSTQTTGGEETTSSGAGDNSDDSNSADSGDTEPTTAPPPADRVPTVEVGPTMNMPIQQWGVQVDLSQKLGDTYYQITGENLVLTSSLIGSLPASCAGDWGMTRTADGGYAVLKPAESCAAAPELYDELWGLMDAMVQTARAI